MVCTGLSAVMGACGMKAMARPSNARRRADAIRTRSSSSNSSDPPVTAKPGGSSCAMARPIMVFPAPDSPTRPRIFPGCSANDSERIAGMTAPSMRALTVRSRASSASIVSAPRFR
jgi:hypothetical protein